MKAIFLLLAVLLLPNHCDRRYVGPINVESVTLSKDTLTIYGQDMEGGALSPCGEFADTTSMSNKFRGYKHIIANSAVYNEDLYHYYKKDNSIAIFTQGQYEFPIDDYWAIYIRLYDDNLLLNYDIYVGMPIRDLLHVYGLETEKYPTISIVRFIEAHDCITTYYFSNGRLCCLEYNIGRAGSELEVDFIESL